MEKLCKRSASFRETSVCCNNRQQSRASQNSTPMGDLRRKHFLILVISKQIYPSEDDFVAKIHCNTFDNFRIQKSYCVAFAICGKTEPE